MNALSPSFAGWLVGWMVDYYLLTTVFLAALLAARRWIRQPAHRLTLVWIVTVELIVLAAVCALPFWPRISLARAATPQETPVVANTQDAMFPIGGPERRSPTPKLGPRAVVADEAAAPETPEDAATAMAADAAEPSHWMEWIAAAYLFGAGVVGLWLGWGAATAGRIRRQAWPAPDSLREEFLRIVPGGGRAPRLLVSSRIANAVAMGLRRPAILLPARLAEAPLPETLRAVLTHEWAHVRRRDLWLLALGRCLLPLLYAHPLLWWLRRVIRDDQEWLADAVAAGEDPHAYAQTLLGLIRPAGGPLPIRGSAAVAIWESPSQLTRRITVLLDKTLRIHPTGSRAWRRGALGVLVFLGVGFSFVTFRPARSAGEPAPRVAASEEPEGQPNDKANAGTAAPDPKKRVAEGPAREDGHIYMAATARADAEQVGISLPGFPALKERAVLKTLEITDEQEKQLREIQRRWVKDLRDFHESHRSVSETLKAYAAWDRQQQERTRKEVEKILTAEQVKTLREMALSERAFPSLTHPKVLGALDATEQQKRQIQQIQRDARQEMTVHAAEMQEQLEAKSLAILTPQQRAKLQETVFDPEGPVVPAQSFTRIKLDTEVVAIPQIHPYPDLSDAQVQTRLGLNESQRDRVRAILGNSETLDKRLAEEARRLSPEERKKLHATDTARVIGDRTPASEQQTKQGQLEEMLRKQQKEQRSRQEENPLWQTTLRLRKQLEAVLTPEQLAAYRETTVRNVGPHVLRDPLVAKHIGLDDGQRAALIRLLTESGQERFQQLREAGKRMIEVLTPTQKAALPDVIDRTERELRGPNNPASVIWVN